MRDMRGIELPELYSLLKEVRLQQGISVELMAVKLGVPPVTYWRIEQGVSAPMKTTAWPMVRRMLRWKLNPQQTETLQRLRERLIQ